MRTKSQKGMYDIPCWWHSLFTLTTPRGKIWLVQRRLVCLHIIKHTSFFLSLAQYRVWIEPPNPANQVRGGIFVLFKKKVTMSHTAHPPASALTRVSIICMHWHTDMLLVCDNTFEPKRPACLCLLRLKEFAIMPGHTWYFKIIKEPSNMYQMSSLRHKYSLTSHSKAQGWDTTTLSWLLRAAQETCLSCRTAAANQPSQQSADYWLLLCSPPTEDLGPWAQQLLTTT